MLIIKIRKKIKSLFNAKFNNSLATIFGKFKSPRILLLNDTSNIENWGCKVTSYYLKRKIREIYPDCVMKTRLFASTKPVDIDFPPSMDELDSFVKNPPEGLLDYSNFKWADIVILNGEGSIHQHEVDIKKFPNPIIKLLELYAAKTIFRKKTISVNQSIGFWDDWFGEYVRSIYSKIDYLSLREPVSYRKCQSLGLDNIRLCSDAAFLLQPKLNLPFPKTLQKKGIRPGFVAVFLSEAIKHADPKKTLNLLLSIKKRLDCQLVGFISGYVDRVHFDSIAKTLKFPIFDPTLSVNDLIASLGYADFVLSGRYHCCIFSAMAGCPFVPFHSNYTEKNNGLMELLKYPIDPFDYVKDSNESVMQEIVNIIYNRDAYKDLLKKGISHASELSDYILPSEERDT